MKVRRLLKVVPVASSNARLFGAADVVRWKHGTRFNAGNTTPTCSYCQLLVVLFTLTQDSTNTFLSVFESLKAPVLYSQKRPGQKHLVSDSAGVTKFNVLV